MTCPTPPARRLGSDAIVWLTWVGCLSLCAACAHGQNTPLGPVVEKLDFEGNRQVSKGDIKGRIATEQTGWWWPFATKRRFDPVTWQSDLRRIERLYESRGFYQAEVVSDEVKPIKGGGVALKAVISEGKPTRVESFEVRGLEVLTREEHDRVLDDLGLVGGAPFLEDHWESAKNQIRARLRNLGFAQAELDGRALVDFKMQKASLLIVVRSGVRYRFGAIEIDLGSEFHVAPVWVWDETRLAIPEDQIYSDGALIEAQRRVFGMGVFAVVKVTTGIPDPNAARIPVVVEAREAPFRTLRTGAGVRIDQIRNEGRLILEWSNRNFLGGLRKLTARAEAGWAFIPNTYAVLSNDVASGPRNGPIARLGLQFEQPRFLSRPSLREQSSLDLERTLEQSYDSIGWRLATGVSWQPRSTVSIYPTYNIQGYWLNGPSIASASAAPLTLGCANQTDKCFILLSYLEQRLTWDRRDSPLETHKGFFAGLSLQEGGGPLGGDFTYFRLLPDVRGTVSVGNDNRLTFSTRLRVGELFPTGGQSAVVTRFFGGGGISMRGFSDRRLSPLLLAPAPPVAGVVPVTLTLPIGGDGLIDGSFETRYRLTENLILAAFVDYGQVTQGRVGPDDISTLLWAVGVGLRYLTPIGPIRIDFARRLQRGSPPPLLAVDATTGAVSRVPYLVNDSCFGLGGSNRSTVVADSLCALHIGIGEAF